MNNNTDLFYFFNILLLNGLIIIKDKNKLFDILLKK
jgi:hypothetical protein